MKKLLLLSLAAIALFSCSKHDEDPIPEPWPEDGWCQFQIHYFVPDAVKNTVVADSMFMNDVLYADGKSGGKMYSYNGLPSFALAQDGSLTPRYFAGYLEMAFRLYKDKKIIYDKKISNLQNGGSYHLVIYDPEKEPAVFTSVTMPLAMTRMLNIKFANFLFQNPTTKYSGTIRLQYSHQDEEDWTTVGNAVKFGEATNDYSIEIPDQYQTLIFRVVDQNGTILSSGEDGHDVTMTIQPEFVNQFSVFFLGGNIEGGQAAEIFQWKSR